MNNLEESIKKLDWIGKPSSLELREEILNFLIKEVNMINEDHNFKWMYDGEFYNEMEIICDENNNSPEDIDNNSINFDIIFRK